MVTFKFVISSKDGKAYQVEKEQSACASLMGKLIGDDFSGDLIGLNGYTLVIRGGSDKDGFPMRNDIEGVMRKKFLLKKGIGFKGTKKRNKKVTVKLDGLRRKRTLRGNTIADDIVQINCIVSKEGSEKLEKLLGGKKKKEGEEKEQDQKAEKQPEKEQDQKTEKQPEKEEPEKEQAKIEKPVKDDKSEDVPKKDIKEKKDDTKALSDLSASEKKKDGE